MRIYAIALGTRDGELGTILKMAVGDEQALQVAKELTKSHINHVFEGAGDTHIEAIERAQDLESCDDAFCAAMQNAHDMELDNAYTAEFLVSIMEVSRGFL